MRARAAALALAFTRRLQQVAGRLLIAGQGSKSAPYAVRRARAQVNVVPVRCADRVLRDVLDLLRADGVPWIFSPRGEEERRAEQKLGC